MIDPVQALFDAGVLQTTLFPPSSRYHGIATRKLERPDGRTLVYLARRFVPAPEVFALLREHVVSAGERPDTLAARFLGDSEQYWRMCDANGVLRPDELVSPAGRRIRITLPAGVPAEEEEG
jgi:hypothetical protein